MDEGAGQQESQFAKIAALAARVCAGERNAETALVQTLIPGLSVLVRKRLGRCEQASDITQQTLMIVLEKLRANEIHELIALASFVRSVATNLICGHLRQPQGEDVETLLETLEDPVSTHADRLEEIELRSMVRACIDELPTLRDREVLRRRYFKEQQKSQTCAELELSPAHYDRVIFRAKQRLKSLIESHFNFRTK